MTAASTDSAKTYGFLFYRSTITGSGSNNTNLGRPWRQGAQVLYRESTLSNAIKTSQPWTNMGDSTWQNARFFEYRNTGPGATVNGNRPQLSDAQAANYTPQKYLAGSELGAGAFTADTLPEDKAADLQAAAIEPFDDDA